MTHKLSRPGRCSDKLRCPRIRPLTGGMTLTFGGLKINENAQRISTGWKPIKGLYTAGERVGGLFHYNDPLGTGLMSCAVFGRIAGCCVGVNAPGPKMSRAA